MAKKRYKSILATGLAVAGAVQMGMTIDANAAPKGNIVTWQEAEEAVNSKLDSTGSYYIVKGKSEKTKSRLE